MWWAYIRGEGAYIREGLIVGGLRYLLVCPIKLVPKLVMPAFGQEKFVRV